MVKLDNWFYKIQRELLKGIMLDNRDLVVCEWQPDFYYVTQDRVAFYIIPKSKFYLSEKYFRRIDEVWDKEYAHCSNVSQIIAPDSHVENIYPTGMIYAKNLREYSEYSAPDKSYLYLSKNRMAYFPNHQGMHLGLSKKNIVLVFNEFDCLLGGIVPITSF